MQGELQSQPPKREWVNLLSICFISLVTVVISPIFEPKTQTIEAVSSQSLIFIEENSSPSIFPITQENTLLAVSEPFINEIKECVKKIVVVATAYSSTPWETDDTPFITASGTYVKKGIIAANFLPFETRVKIPEIYGDRIFVVEDRMHPRNDGHHIDIWFPSYWEALNFGAKTTYIEILEE